MSKNDKIYEQVSVAFEKLSPNNGDIITVTLPDDMVVNQIKAFSQILTPLVEEHGVSIVFLTKGVKLKLVSESEMNKNGWFKFNPEQMN